MSNNIKVMGRRIIVEKEKVDCSGLNLTPAMDEDGQKNKGTIIAVGQVGIFARIRGIRKGAKVVFHKHFIANHEDENPLCFVELEEVLGIIK